MQDCPNPSVAPEAATLRQLHALRTGDTATVFAFASPANRRATGPLERFAALLESPIYRPLVGHLDCEVRPANLPDCAAMRLGGSEILVSYAAVLGTSHVPRVNVYRWKHRKALGAYSWCYQHWEYSILALYPSFATVVVHRKCTVLLKVQCLPCTLAETAFFELSRHLSPRVGAVSGPLSTTN